MKKAEARKYYLEKRKALSRDAVEKRSVSIKEQFFNSTDLTTISLLHVFIPIQKFNEVNSWLIIEEVWKFYPHIKIATSITKKDALSHVLIDSNTIFIEDKWGIPTPQNCIEVQANEIDLVVTPLLSFDKNLQRVGYGKGYYDKFFSDCKPEVKKIGVSLFSVMEELIEDTNHFDIALDIIIS